jgi:hypothetical protein
VSEGVVFERDGENQGGWWVRVMGKRGKERSKNKGEKCV